jgi:hypothetical protein
MYIISYYKSKGTWFLDRKGVYNNEQMSSDPERTGTFAQLLEVAAGGEDNVELYLDFKSFPHSDEAVRVEEVKGMGAYYTIEKFCGRAVHTKFWVNTLLFMKEKPMPEKLYLRKIERDYKTTREATS